MTMKSNRKRHQDFTSGLLFLMEQWIALLVGVACLGVFLWAALDGHKAFSIHHSSHFSPMTLVSTGWLLTIFVGLSGVTLTRFAFYRQREPGPDAKSPKGRVPIASGGSTENSSRFTSTAGGRRSR
jgi:hypothetical protein